VVEFALVLPLFCAMLFATVDYGWYFYQKFTLAAALQTGVRAAATFTEKSKPDDAWEVAHKSARDYLNAQGAIPGDAVTYGPADSSLHYGGIMPARYITLTGQYTITPLVGFVPLPSPTLSFTASMVLDAQNAGL
jgi:hypothetical protein